MGNIKYLNWLSFLKVCTHKMLELYRLPNDTLMDDGHWCVDVFYGCHFINHHFRFSRNHQQSSTKNNTPFFLDRRSQSDNRKQIRSMYNNFKHLFSLRTFVSPFQVPRQKKYLSYAYNTIDSQKAYASKENKIGFLVTSNIIRLRSLLKSYRKMIAHQIIQYTNLSETKMIKNLSI